ncbi:hypothetical protein RMSM_05213 [Rhodopirellula maiorica SM1]|uniref:Uncharacterized protein n=1 Tax=Rhodopirellula maiorica SM1 TaxID=1265738 RepID=M5RES0_9BACT|nr:hypothetical protein RMSM_05213 [Rhodopirellula maiorica SM1]
MPGDPAGHPIAAQPHSKPSLDRGVYEVFDSRHRVDSTHRGGRWVNRCLAPPLRSVLALSFCF